MEIGCSTFGTITTYDNDLKEPPDYALPPEATALRLETGGWATSGWANGRWAKDAIIVFCLGCHLPEPSPDLLVDPGQGNGFTSLSPGRFVVPLLSIVPVRGPARPLLRFHHAQPCLTAGPTMPPINHSATPRVARPRPIFHCSALNDLRPAVAPPGLSSAPIILHLLGGPGSAMPWPDLRPAFSTTVLNDQLAPGDVRHFRFPDSRKLECGISDDADRIVKAEAHTECLGGTAALARPAAAHAAWPAAAHAAWPSTSRRNSVI